MGRTLRRLALGGLGVYLAVLAVNRSVVRVQGPSMEPALWAGDRLLTLPAVRRLLAPGSVVVVEDPARAGHPVVKRLVAVGPDGVDVRGDDPARSTDSGSWGVLPASAVRRIAVARWPDLRTPLWRHPEAIGASPKASSTGA